MTIPQLELTARVGFPYSPLTLPHSRRTIAVIHLNVFFGGSSMKRLVSALSVLLLCSTMALACGKERWAVKVLKDADRGQIARAAKVQTVAELAALDGPPNADRTAPTATAHRIAPPEKTTYKVTAMLLGYRKEADGDFHLVLKDLNSDATMIAEIPDPACLADQALATNAGNFRNTLVAKFGQPGKKTKRLAHPAKITIRGVGFFDVVHATEQDGAAPNNLEVHPVLGMSLSAG